MQQGESDDTGEVNQLDRFPDMHQFETNGWQMYELLLLKDSVNGNGN